MDDIFPINISSDDENSLISSRSGFAGKSRKRIKNSPSPDVSRMRSARVVGMMAPSPPVESRSKRKRVTRKKKEPNENKGPITVNRKISQGTIIMLHPIGPLGVEEVCETHHYLAGKKVILYGLPGYLAKPYTSGWSQEEYLRRSKIWNDFRVERVIKPAYEFINRIDKLIGQGVNEALLFTVNSQVLCGVVQDETLREKFKTIKFVADYTPNISRSLYKNLGLQYDIPVDENIPPRSRKFLLLIDDLVVKYVNIESSDGHFVLPTDEEILNVFRR